MKSTILPRNIKSGYLWARAIRYYFLISQVLGIVLLGAIARQFANGLKNLDITNINTPKIQLNRAEHLIEGLSLSWGATILGFLVLSAYSMRKPYKFKSLRTFYYTFIIEILYIIWKVYSIYSSKNIDWYYNLGEFLTLLTTLPLLVKFNHKDYKRWSAEYLPPPPEI